MRSMVRLIAALLLIVPGLGLAQTATEPPNTPAQPAAGAAEATESQGAGTLEAAEPRAEGRSINIELNKFESVENACRAYFVIENRTPEVIRELRLIVYFFDKNGVILASGNSLSFNDVPAQRTRVGLFNIPELACGDIGRALIDEVVTCATSEGAVTGCAEMVATSTRTDIAFEY